MAVMMELLSEFEESEYAVNITSYGDETTSSQNVIAAGRQQHDDRLNLGSMMGSSSRRASFEPRPL